MELPKSLSRSKDPVKRRNQKRLAQARYRKTLKGIECNKRYKKSKAGIATKNRNHKKWIARNGLKFKAHKMVATAIQYGRLVKMPCEKCGDIKSVAHHDDYFKPLDVRWFCRKCHNEVHCIPRYKEVFGV